MDKLVSGQAIRIINEHGQIEDGYILVDPKEDRRGLLAVRKNDTPETDEAGTPIPPLYINKKRIVTGDTQENVMQAEIAKPKQVKVAPTKIDVAEIAAAGELWIRAGIDFDGTTEVSTYCLLVTTKNRYITFNTYNGTFGKKGNKPPIAELMTGADIGYPIKDIDKLRAKLVKGGYKQHEV